MTALIPCPFCGGHLDLKVFAYGVGTKDADCYVQCQACTTCGPSAKTPKDAAAKWNWREDSTMVTLRFELIKLSKRLQEFEHDLMAKPPNKRT